MDRKGSRNMNSHHMSSLSNDLTGKIIPEILEHRILNDEHHANVFPQVVTDPTQDTSLLIDNQRIYSQQNSQQSTLDDAAFKIYADSLQNSIHSGVSDQDLQNQISQVIIQLQEALASAKKPNISKLVKTVFDEQQQKIESLKRSISQTQSVSPSAYQILKEDNTRQVQLILNLQQKQEKQDLEIIEYKKKIDSLQDSLSYKDEEIVKILKEQSNQVSQEKLKQTEESLKRVTEEMGLLYEQTQDHQKEIKKLKKDLKEAQRKEKDYLSVLKNTSEFGKITESTQQLIKMAIEQQNKNNNHNQMQIQQQHQAQLQMGAIISQNASLASKIVAQISPTVPFKIEGFPAYNLQQPVHLQTTSQNIPNAVGLPMPFDLEQETRNEGQREIKPQTEVARDSKPLGLGKGVPKLNLKLAMKNTSNLEPNSEEMRGKKLSNLSRYKANLKAEGQASAQKLLQATSSVKGQRHFNFNQSEIENLQNPQEKQNETLSPNKDGTQKFGINTASRDSQVGQGLVSQRNTSYKTIIQSSSKNIRTIISESDKRDEEDEVNDRIDDLQNNVADGGQNRLFQESSTTPKLVPPIFMKKLTTNLEQLTQPKMGLDFKKLNRIKDFQDEFMDNFDDFSLSWREAIQRQRRF